MVILTSVSARSVFSLVKSLVTMPFWGKGKKIVYSVHKCSAIVNTGSELLFSHMVFGKQEGQEGKANGLLHAITQFAMTPFVTLSKHHYATEKLAPGQMLISHNRCQ